MFQNGIVKIVNADLSVNNLVPRSFSSTTKGKSQEAKFVGKIPFQQKGHCFFRQVHEASEKVLLGFASNTFQRVSVAFLHRS